MQRLDSASAIGLETVDTEPDHHWLSLGGVRMRARRRFAAAALCALALFGGYAGARTDRPATPTALESVQIGLPGR